MNIALYVKTQCADAVAAALSYGYAIRIDRSRVDFPIGRTVEDRRNANGRCTRHVREYADGSRLIFTWSESRGARYEVQP